MARNHKLEESGPRHHTPPASSALGSPPSPCFSSFCWRWNRDSTRARSFLSDKGGGDDLGVRGPLRKASLSTCGRPCGRGGPGWVGGRAAPAARAWPCLPRCSRPGALPYRGAWLKCDGKPCSVTVCAWPRPHDAVRGPGPESHLRGSLAAVSVWVCGSAIQSRDQC